MKRKNITAAISICALMFSLVIPSEAFADTGSNDFTATLSIPDTMVEAGEEFDTMVSVTNLDQTYGADVTIQTSAGQFVSSFYLAAGASQTITQTRTLQKTASIYYIVIASHGPDLSKTKNTNSVTVTVGGSTPPEPTPEPETGPEPSEEFVAEPPEPEFDPVGGVPKSGSAFMLTLEEFYVNGEAVPLNGSYIWSFGGPVMISGRLHYELPDSIMADYFSRDESDYVNISVECSPGTEGSGLADTITDEYSLDSDSGDITFEYSVNTYVVPELYDAYVNDLYFFTARLMDPLGGDPLYEYTYFEFVCGALSPGEYEIYMQDTFYNGARIDPSDVINVTYGEPFTISQDIFFSMPEEELLFDDSARASIYTDCTLDGHFTAGFSGGYAYNLVPDTNEGILTLDIVADSDSYADYRLSYGTHEIEISAAQARSYYPIVDNRTSVTITVNVVEESEEGSEPSEGPEEEPAEVGPFSGLMEMSIFEWLGLDWFSGSSIDLTVEPAEYWLDRPGSQEISGTVEFDSPEAASVRISGSEGFGDPLVLERFTPEGVATFSKTVYADEPTDYELTAELLAEDGSVLAADTGTVSVFFTEPEESVDYTQSFSFEAIPEVVERGGSATLYYSLSNDLSGETVHARIIDENTGDIVFEDEGFAPYEIRDGSVIKTPLAPVMYSFTAQVLSDDGGVLWEQTNNSIVSVPPFPVEDDGEEAVFNLNIAASTSEIAAGEDVTIYGSIVYGVSGSAPTEGEVSVVVADQDGHVLFATAGVMPGDPIEFSETYTLDSTTTFAITAAGLDASGSRVLEDTDTLTVTVAGGSPPVGPGDDGPVYDMVFLVDAADTVIAPGESAVITATLGNLGTENIAGIIMTDTAVFGGAAGWIEPGGGLMGTESFTLDETTTIILRAQAATGAGVIIYDETEAITIIVDPALAEDAPEEEPLYGLDLNIAASEMMITRGESVDLYLDITNTGDQAVDAIVTKAGGDDELFDGFRLDPGERYDDVLSWAPETTSAAAIAVRGFDESGAEVCSDEDAVTVTVSEPPETVALVDLVAGASVSGDEGYEFTLDIANTGTVPFAGYSVAESLHGSHLSGSGLLPGDADHQTLPPWIPDRATTIIFVVQAFDESGSVIATDSESLMVVPVETEDEEGEPVPVVPEDEGASEPEGGLFGPVEEDGGEPEESSPADDSGSSGSGEEASGEASGPVDEADDTSASGGGVFEGGLELSLEQAHAVLPDNGSITLVSSKIPSGNAADPATYRTRRIIAVIFVALLLLVVFLVILVIVLASKAKKKRKQGN